MQPSRFVMLDPDRPLLALTATTRGMIDGTFIRAAQRARTELMTAVAAAGQHASVRSHVAFVPDTPVGMNDASCRYVAGVLFGHELASQQGEPGQPAVPLTGSLAWWPLAPGRYAVFTHLGPYDTLKLAWDAIYREWLPSSGEALRGDGAPMELSVNTPEQVSPEKLHTEIWIPLA